MIKYEPSKIIHEIDKSKVIMLGEYNGRSKCAMKKTFKFNLIATETTKAETLEHCMVVIYSLMRRSCDGEGLKKWNQARNYLKNYIKKLFKQIKP